MFDTRFKEFLRSLNPADRTVQMRPQMIRVLVHAVGEIAFAMRPNVFNGIEFRRVAGEPVDMKPPGLLKKRFDIRPFMDGAAVPEQDNMPAQVAQQIP